MPQAVSTPNAAYPYRLELLARLPQLPGTRPPLLFVHGAFAGAWCWDEYFLPYFASHGYPAYALSLRGHGASSGHERLFWTGLDDYVNDLVHAVSQLEQHPILIGHSMGGIVVQKYLEKHGAPAAALLASVPPDGLAGITLRLLTTDLLLFQQVILMQYGGSYWIAPHQAKRLLFSAETPNIQALDYLGRMQQESQRVILDLYGFSALPPRAVDLPILVLGAHNDSLVHVDAVTATARHYSTQAELLPLPAHAMMLDTHWQQAATALHRWLDGLQDG